MVEDEGGDGGLGLVELDAELFAQGLGQVGVVVHLPLGVLRRALGHIVEVDVHGEVIEAVEAQTPLRRWGQPDDIADAVLYLATGTTLNVSVDNITNELGLTEGNPRQGFTQSIVNGYFYGRGIVGPTGMVSLTAKF